MLGLPKNPNRLQMMNPVMDSLCSKYQQMIIENITIFQNVFVAVRLRDNSMLSIVRAVIGGTCSQAKKSKAFEEVDVVL